MWGGRRVMWRQADNPLAPSDKYEALAAFSAFSRHWARLSVEKNGKGRRGGEREKMGAHAFFSTRGESLKHRVKVASDTHTHTPSSDLSITDLRIFFFYLFELILSSRVRNWIARNKSAASYFGGARLDQGVPWTILLLFIWTIFRGGRSMVGCQTQTGNIRDFETV